LPDSGIGKEEAKHRLKRLYALKRGFEDGTNDPALQDEITFAELMFCGFTPAQIRDMDEEDVERFAMLFPIFARRAEAARMKGKH
jgi:hypothetical protein